jgi:hypothetical protein
VLLPSNPANCYRLLDIVPTDRVGDLGRAKIVIGVFTETPQEMVRRVTREFGTKHNIIGVRLFWGDYASAGIAPSA